MFQQLICVCVFDQQLIIIKKSNSMYIFYFGKQAWNIVRCRQVRLLLTNGNIGANVHLEKLLVNLRHKRECANTNQENALFSFTRFEVEQVVLALKDNLP